MAKMKPKDPVAVLKAAIKDLGLTLYAVAKKADCTPEQLYRFVKRERDLRFATVAKLMDVVGLELKPKSK